MLGTTLPTPLYVIYQAQWHFSAAIVTVTFAVYAVAVLATLLLAGRSSDQAGRKPVLAVALGSSALSTVVFILAPNVGVLFAGRILSGLSAGLMTGTATAALTELVPASASRRASLVATAANMGGLGLGPLIAGLFAQYAPHPTVLVFEVYLAVLAVAGLCLFLVPETVSPRRRPALRFTGLGIPERGRSEFIAAGAAAFAAFSLLGLFAALAPTFLGDVLHEESHAVQGGVVFLLLAVGTVTQLLLARFTSRRVVMAGLGLFLAALALIVAALVPGRHGAVPGRDGRGRGGRGCRLPGQPGHDQCLAAALLAKIEGSARSSGDQAGLTSRGGHITKHRRFAPWSGHHEDAADLTGPPLPRPRTTALASQQVAVSVVFGGLLRMLGGAHQRDQARARVGGARRRRGARRPPSPLDSGDDGVGCVDPARGSGLIGLRDRMEARGGVARDQRPSRLKVRRSVSSSRCGSADVAPAPPDAAVGGLGPVSPPVTVILCC